MSKLPFFFLPTLLASTSALAQYASLNCSGHPSCEELGYSKADVPDCKEYLYCLYDHSYKVCLPDCGNSNTCPDGTLTEAECSAQNGFLYYGCVDTNGCGKCTTCSLGDLYPSSNRPANQSCYQIGVNTHNSSMYCCTTCPKGKKTEGECKSLHGFIKNGTLDSTTGCGECLICEEGTSPSADKTRCVSPCEAGCPDGTTYITSADQITDNGSYCLGEDITLPYSYSHPKDLKFYSSKTPECSNKELKIASPASQIISYVKTIVQAGAAVSYLELHNGGEFQTPMPCGNFSAMTSGCQITGKNCQVKLYGNHEYYFHDAGSNTGYNLPSIVSCSLEGGTPLTKPTLLFQSAPYLSGYLFSGTHGYSYAGHLTCQLGSAGNSCAGVKCYRKVQDPTNKGFESGEIKRGENSCY